MERASPDECLADNSIIPACGPCSVALSDSPDLGASLFQVLGVTGLQRQSSCANWSFDEGRPKSFFPHRGLHGFFSRFYWQGGALFFVHKLSARACSSVCAFDWVA